MVWKPVAHCRIIMHAGEVTENVDGLWPTLRIMKVNLKLYLHWSIDSAALPGERCCFQRALLTHLSYEIWAFAMADLSPALSSLRSRKGWGARAGVSAITLVFIFWEQRFKADPGTKDITTSFLVREQVGSGISWGIYVTLQVGVSLPWQLRARKTPATCRSEAARPLLLKRFSASCYLRLSAVLHPSVSHPAKLEREGEPEYPCKTGCCRALCPLPSGTAAHITERPPWTAEPLSVLGRVEWAVWKRQW